MSDGGGELAVLALGLALVLALKLILWVASLARRDVSIIDIFWGANFVALGWLYFALAPATTLRAWAVVTLLTVWGGRLSLYLLWRKWGEEEDYRYREMRERQGPSFAWKSLLSIFFLQGLILWVVAMPIWQATRAPQPAGLTPLDLAGIALFVIGFLFEAGGDLQLARFKADPANRGKVMDRGFWRYTRHPNYFGDATIWWGFFLFALATPGGAWTVVGPLVMTGLLLKVSGVALLERRLVEAKPKYRDYVERTNAFFPWLPRAPKKPKSAKG